MTLVSADSSAVPTAQAVLVIDDVDGAVVRMGGQHDTFTRELLVRILDDAMSLEQANVVVDLSRVQYMSAATLDVIMRARKALGARSRSLTLRSPSPIAARLLDVCHIAYRVDHLSRPVDGDRQGPAGRHERVQRLVRPA